MQSSFPSACKRQPRSHPPTWVMRQAGRYLPEYRELRSKVDFESLTRRADLAAEVTLQPLRRFELDAAILFRDIMTPVSGMGRGFVLRSGSSGPQSDPHGRPDRRAARVGAGAGRALRARVHQADPTR